MVMNVSSNSKNDEDYIDIPEVDLKWSTVSLNEILTNKTRLEASVFNLEGKHAREIINKTNWEKIPLCGDGGLASAYHRPRFKRVFLDKSTLPIYQPSQILDVYPKPNLFISDKTGTSIEKLRVKKGQILLTCSGTIGNVSLVSKTLDNCIFSHDLIRIDVNNIQQIGYLYAFLKSNLGKVLLTTNNYGAVVKHIEPEHLESLLIPVPRDSIVLKINKIILDSFNLRDDSNILIDKANKLLESELNLNGIDELKIKYFINKNGFKNYSTKLSLLSNRFDASYHVPIVNSIVNHLKKSQCELTTLDDKRISKRIILPGRFKRIYVEEGQGTVFFGGKQIYELDPSNKKYLSSLHHGKRIAAQLFLEKNFIVITCSGTIGKVNIVPKHWEGWTMNQHVIRVVPVDESIAGYIYTWLSSDYGYELINRFTYGAVVNEIDDKHVSKIQIPLLNNKKIQDKINELVLDANNKRYLAYIKEQEALKIINDEVFNVQ